MKKEKSCGCIIYRYNLNKREFLCIRQRNGNHVGFPKGHVEINESEVQTAIREVKEETNLDVFVFDDIMAKNNYMLYQNIDKEVVYFLATPTSFDLIKQDEEIIDMMWIEEKDVEMMITYQVNKDVFKEIMSQYHDHIEYQLDINLVSYLYQTILPMYTKFDKAHQFDHVHQVLKTSLEIASKLDKIRLDLVYVIAFYHDIGLLFGREHHHMTGGQYLADDLMIKKYFSLEDIKVMRQAIEDHRASHEDTPRTIYGKIIAEADRDIVPEVIIERTILYGLSHFPDVNKQQHMVRAFEHLQEKYGVNGYLQLWLDSKKNVDGLRDLRLLLSDETKIYTVISKKYDKLIKT